MKNISYPALPSVGALLIAKVRLYTFLNIPDGSERWYPGCVGDCPFIEERTPVMYMGEFSTIGDFSTKKYFGWKVLHSEKIVGVGIDNQKNDDIFCSYYFDVYDRLTNEWQK